MSRLSMHGDYTIYDSLYTEARRRGFQGWGGDARIAGGAEQVRRILGNPDVPSSGRALELGCGEGHLCRLLAARGFDVTGVDVSMRAIEWAIEKHSADDSVSAISYRQADLCQPEVLDGEVFDLIVDGNCLHCIIEQDRRAFLRNVHRLLSDHGVFFVSSLCGKSGEKEAETVILLRADQAYRHIASAPALVRELEQAQFDVLDWEVRARDAYDHLSLFARKKSHTSVPRVTS